MKKTTSKRPPSRRGGAETKSATPNATARPLVVTEGAEQPPEAAGASFPIVGIGASAGGIEALGQFLKHVPEQTGMGFVVVQHLDPLHQGTMADLLQRSTKMPVAQVVDQQRVEPNHVYVIPPGKDMSIMSGALHLFPRELTRGVNLPIDLFFRSLADERQDRAIGVVLSGMGSDGTLGLRALKEKAGVAFVQSLASAKFDGMPRSAIEAGLADVIAPVEELPARIVAYRKYAARLNGHTELPMEEKSQGDLGKVLVLLRSHTGNDFSLYKPSTVQRRIVRRLGLHQIDDLGHYVRYLRENPHEIDLLFRELLIGVTSFFRDPATWDFLKQDVIPGLLAAHTRDDPIRAWIPGCSTGEEAYSLAILFKEAMESMKLTSSVGVQIFATDIDRTAIDTARVGCYPPNISADVSGDRLTRYFLEEERCFRVRAEIREMVVFAPQNIIMDPPFTRLDLVSCRNLLIYLTPALQKRLIPLFHYALNPGGVLFLGSAETVGLYTSLFSPADGKLRVYRRLESGVNARPEDFSVPVPSRAYAGRSELALDSIDLPSPATPNLQTLADRVLLQRFSPASILTTDKGEILYISGRTGNYLEPAAGRAHMNLFAMAREGLRHELTEAFASALRENRAVEVPGIVVGTNGGSKTVNLTVQRLDQPKELRGSVMVVIADAPAAENRRPNARRDARKAAQSNEIATALQRAEDEVHSIREQMQTSQEELKSMNEELQSTNEELQSTNEELTTSKEEMQSMNEELQTVNQELQSKVDELSRANNDMKNLLNSTEIATLFLDGNLFVRRFTSPTANLIKLIPTDVGRPIGDIARAIDYPELLEDVRRVIETLVAREKVVAGPGGRWFTVRIMPYRTLENVIDGAVVTFTDASSMKSAQADLRQQASDFRDLRQADLAFREMTEAMPNLVLGCRSDGGCDYVGPRWITYAGQPATAFLGEGWLEFVDERDRESIRKVWRQVIGSANPADLDLRLRNENGGVRWFKGRAAPVRDATGKIVRWYVSCLDVDDLKRTAERVPSEAKSE